MGARSNATEENGYNEYDEEHAFDHPALHEPQPWIWVPRDPLGLSGLLVGELTSAGVEASDVGAVMNEKGVVDVSRGPPDEEWKGGHDH
ncbi:phosphate metabolism protein-domain-containing protein [Schizophyllum amplum]|uniref:Phosphate metabolism protein-domain-containing protein n=1 Tax=Schizophyllum amplum TaxID=97359 RepID=A0A550C926_9AGAR|nr:phosphate metabolism protein-domain-containing protein [Auriculariopsis ampla]